MGEAARVLGSKRRLALSAAILVIVTGFLASTVLAVFTDLTTNDGNSFSSGSVDLTVSPATAVVTMSDMAPGDRVAQPLAVTNTGLLDLRYAIESTTTDDVLASALELTIKSGVATCTTDGVGLSGTVIAGPIPLGSTATQAVLGNAAQGGDPGDRTLAAGAAETLCFDVALPLATDNTAAGLSTTATFEFHSEQTSANP